MMAGVSARPQQTSPANDVTLLACTEITAIKGVPAIAQEKILGFPEPATAMECRKHPALEVARPALCNSPAAHRDNGSCSAQPLAGKGRHVLQQRNAGRKIATRRRKPSGSYRRPCRDHVSAMKGCCREDQVKTARNTGTCVPEQANSRSSEGQAE